ncbi:MAG: asparaginase [Gemmatimonadetes bacterium]|nr:asparaginase [Gemmatimonadota bacterium]
MCWWRMGRRRSSGSGPGSWRWPALRTRASRCISRWRTGCSGRSGSRSRPWPAGRTRRVGADGIYCAALPWAGLGIALKVEDGDMRSSAPALMSVLHQLSARRDLGFAPQGLPAAVKRHVTLPIVNTRGVETGVTRAEGALRF